MTSTDGDDGPRTLKTVRMATRVVTALKEMNGARVTELADRFDISRSTAYIHLKTLEKSGFVVQRGEQYELALQFLAFGEFVRNESLLYRHGKSAVDELAEKTDQYTHIVAEENGRGINVYQTKGDTGVEGNYQTTKLHERDHLHYTASGKAILAFLPDDRVRAIVDTHGLPARTENTITDIETLFDELAAIRGRGYAYNDEEEIEGFRAVGAPIRASDGRVLGSLSVSGPRSVMKGDRFRKSLPEEVMRSANIIEVNINMETR